MNNIGKLTSEQKDRMPEYVNKWVDVATSTKEVSLQEQQEIVSDFRTLIDMNPNVPIVVGSNPIECWVLCCLHEQGVAIENLQHEMELVFNGNSSYDIPQATLPYNTCLLSYVFSFYDYVFNEVGIEIDESLLNKYKTWERTSNIWAIYPLDSITIICKKPVEIYVNEQNTLHRDGGPALRFEGLGNFEVFALNGVRVPEYLAVTPSHKLDLKQYYNETNADVKAEFVQKVGIERFLQLGKLIDSYTNYDQEDHSWWWKSEYELWEMKEVFPGLNSAPFLKMLNPTTKVWHMEGVSPQCQDLKSALKERFGGREMKIIGAA